MTQSDMARIESERRRAEEALRERKELNQLLMDNANDFFRLLELDGRSVRESPSVERFYGRIPAHMFEFAHPEDVERCERWWKRAAAGGKDRLVWRARDASGSWHWFETAASLVPFRGRPLVLTVCRDISEQRRAEDALRRSEADLAEAQRAARIGSWSYDIAGNRVWWSQELYRIFDIERAAVGGTPDAFRPQAGDHDRPGLVLLGTYEAFYSRIHPDDRARVLQVNADAGAGGNSFEVEYRITTPGGGLKHIREVGYARKDESGVVTGLFGTAQDVTDRKRAEEALRETTAKLNEAQRIAHIGHWEQDLETNLTTASDETYRIFGLRPQEDLRTWAAWQEHVHPDDREVRAAAIAAALREGPRYGAEYRVIRPDGEVRIVRSQGEVTRDGAGRPRRLFGIVQDITERRQAERALREAERRLQHVLESSPAVLYTLAVEGGQFRGVDWMSNNIQAMLGYRAEDTIGADWLPTNIHPDDREAVTAKFLSGIVKSDHMVAEFRFRHRNGRFHWIRSENRLLRDAAGNPTEVVGSWSDVTERKQLEDQFRQAQKMEAVGHLAGGVAHDFNNLLTVIAGYSEILLPELPATDPKRQMVSEIRLAGQRAAGLTRQLLAFSRQTVLEPKVLDLNEVVRENERMLRRLIGEDVQLTAVLDSALRPVKVDPGQIGQVIMNLAVNARDAMPQGGKLTIETGNVKLDETSVGVGPEAKPGRYALLAVTDTGTGMSPEVQAHIFEPFFTTKGPGKGTGLGLATVYGIVKQSGGFIYVYSEPGRGTTFKLYLPIVAEPAAAEKSLPGVKAAAGGVETILLVEDEDAVRSMIRLVLRRAGYTVLEASRGMEAVRLVEQHSGPVHLLITDVVMPEMGGRQLVEHLARRRPDLKVLYLSGYTDDAVVRHGILQADVAFLQKPFTMAALTNKVRQVLDAVVSPNKR